MKKNIINCFLFLFLFILIGCHEKGIVVLENINKDTLIIIPIKYANPTGVILKIKGSVSDTCNINDFLILPKGKIDTTFTYDYYDNKKIILKYNKYKSTKTTLQIAYFF